MEKFTIQQRHSQITAAFKDLKKLGYFAEQDFMCCQSCGWAAVPDGQASRAVFYHAQDAEAFEQPNPQGIYLAWSGDADEICKVLEARGLDVERLEDSSERIWVNFC
jgi:hypothetical protein